MTVKTLSWQPGFVNRGVAVEDAVAELDKLRAEGEYRDIDPHEVVQLAKPTKNALHPIIYDLNDKDAAHEYRIRRAKAVCNSIMVYEKKIKAKVRKFHTVHIGTSDSKPVNVYRDIDDIMRDPVTRQELFERALRDAMNFRRKFARIRELKEVFEAIDRVTAKHGELLAKK